MIKFTPEERTSLSDLITSPLFQGYEMCFMLVSEEYLPAAIDRMVKDPENLYGMCIALSAAGISHDNLEWGLELIWTNIDRIDVSFVLSDKLGLLLEKNIESAAGTKLKIYVQNLKRSSQGTIESPEKFKITHYPKAIRKVSRNGWYYEPAGENPAGIKVKLRAQEVALERLYISLPTQSVSYLFEPVLNSPVFDQTITIAGGPIGIQSHLAFDLVRMEVIEITTEKSHRLKRYNPRDQL